MSANSAALAGAFTLFPDSVRLINRPLDPIARAVARGKFVASQSNQKFRIRQPKLNFRRQWGQPQSTPLGRRP
jgi:hypothetical protein